MTTLPGKGNLHLLQSPSYDRHTNYNRKENMETIPCN
jgi:hypothetical protein